MSRNKDNEYKATKVEKTFDDDGNIKVADIPSPNKKNLNPIRQLVMIMFHQKLKINLVLKSY